MLKASLWEKLYVIRYKLYAKSFNIYIRLPVPFRYFGTLGTGRISSLKPEPGI